jgi:hypothetical protein
LSRGSALPVVAKAAAFDLAVIGGDYIAECAAAEFPAGE